MALVDFTLSNARRFYSSMGNPLGWKGLIRMLMHYFASARFRQWLFCKSERLLVRLKTWVLNSVPYNFIGGL